MYPIPEGLIPAEKNKLNSYLPVRNKGNDYDWETITGMVLSHALKKQIGLYEFEQFREDCQQRFINKLDEPGFWPVLDRMYFATQAVFRTSPLFLLFKAQRKGSAKADLGAANARMGELFSSMMGGYQVMDPIDDKLNFIEQEMLAVLNSKISVSQGQFNSNEQPYLPYLASLFQADMAFLVKHPQYLLQELTNTLKLYAFAYCAQLALNVTDWRSGQPVSKPLYFILDTEKASSERVCVQRYGHKMLAAACERLFPMLSALDVLQLKETKESKQSKRPLWQVYQDVVNYPDQIKLLTDLNSYLQAFMRLRKLDLRGEADSIDGVFEQLKELALEQFRDEDTTRGEINKKYTKELEKQVCADFIQSRGRAGKVLVLNQDQLLLLTNLAIGHNEKLRLHELMRAFEQRGFYLDNQSQQVLVSFYERMGNVERMSDSGDAVYVRKTI